MDFIASARIFKKYKYEIVNIMFSLAIFGYLASVIKIGDRWIGDLKIYSYIIQFRTDTLDIFMKFVSNLCSTSTLLILACIFYGFLYFRKKDFKFGHLILINVLLVWILNYSVKLIFHRVRPDILRLIPIPIDEYSFPSGHAMISMAYYGLLIYFSYTYLKTIWEKIAIIIPLGILILIIGLSRVYLGVHFESDVLAGYALGFSWINVFIIVLRKFFLIYSEKP